MRGSRIYLASLCVVLAAFTLFLSVPASATATTERVSVSSSGEQGNGGVVWFERVAVSADGRFVAFGSQADNLVDGDTNNRSDVFVRDRLSGLTTRVSVSSAGDEGNDGSFVPAISADGRYIAFDSDATNLVADDTNGQRDVFLHDTQTGETKRLSVSSTGVQADSWSDTAAVSADGAFVAFRSNATNLVVGDTNGTRDIYLRDVAGGITRRVSVSSMGAESNGTSATPSISADGNCVAFWSDGSNLVGGDTNAKSDVFLRDVAIGVTELISVSTSGQLGNGLCDAPCITPDGRFVAFSSTASNLVPGDTNGFYDAFVRDRLTEVTKRVSLSTTGVQCNGDIGPPALGANGRYVAFFSKASNLVPGDTNGCYDVFANDLVSGVTQRLSLSSSEVQGDGLSHSPAISSDGKSVAFLSDATNLVADDTNGVRDTFVRDWQNGFRHPENVSISPSVGPLSSAPFTVTCTYHDADGDSDITRNYLLINDSSSQANAAFFWYDRVANKLYLKNDANTSWGIGYAPGTEATLENSQCCLYVKETVVTGSSVQWRVELKPTFVAKELKGYMYVQDYAGHTDGWNLMAYYYNVKPQVVSVNPPNGVLPIGERVALTSIYSDPNGCGDLNKCYMLVNDMFEQAHAIFLMYNQAANRVYLKDDANTSWGTGKIPGDEGILENSQCIVYIESTTVTSAGSHLAITWTLVIKADAFDSDNLCSWMFCSDLGGLYDGYKKVGTHFNPVAPTCVSAVPCAGSVPTGTEQVFTTEYSDGNGYADIMQCYLQLGVTGSLAQTVCVMYDAKENKVYLRDDANTTWGTGYAPGTEVKLENTQCLVYVDGVTVTPSGSDNMVINWTIYLKPSQAGRLLGVRMYCRDNEWLNSSWKWKGHVRAL